MNIKYDPDFIAKLKKTDVRVRKAFKKRIEIFEKNPLSPKLHNHPLKGEYTGYRSINITVDFRAIYKQIDRNDESIAYFSDLGTHKQLYG